METINDLATAAVNAVWGPDKVTAQSEALAASKQEPLSGVSGDPTKGEPYDAGNLTMAPSSPYINSIAAKQEEPQSGVSGDHTKGKPYDTRNSTPAPPSPGISSVAATQEPSLGISGGSVNAKPHDGGSSTSINIPVKAAREDESDGKNHRGMSLSTTQQISCNEPGPRSTKTPRKKGNTYDADAAASETNSTQPTSRDANWEGMSFQESSSESRGPPEQHAQSTKLHAEGSEFNISKPCMGAEADELQEKKRDHENGQDDHEPNGRGKVKTHPGKRSLGERIKAKFHKH